MFNELRVLSIKIIIYKKGEIDGTKRKYVICYTTRIIGNSVKAEFFTRHHYCLRDDILRLKRPVSFINLYEVAIMSINSFSQQ